MELFDTIAKYYNNLLKKQITKDQYTNSIISLIAKESFITDIQSKLHRIIIEDLLIIRKAILALNEIKPPNIRRPSHPKIQPKE